MVHPRSALTPKSSDDAVAFLLLDRRQVFRARPSRNRLEIRAYWDAGAPFSPESWFSPCRYRRTGACTAYGHRSDSDTDVPTPRPPSALWKTPPISRFALSGYARWHPGMPALWQGRQDATIPASWRAIPDFH